MPPRTLRPGQRADLPAIRGLYNHFVRQTAITFDTAPWTVEGVNQWFEPFAGTGRHQLFVALCEDQLLGFCCSRPFRTKVAYASTVETTVYLAPQAQGAGLGTALYRQLFTALQGTETHKLVAAMTMPNPASSALHEKLGFNRCGLMREVGFKFDRYWDVQWFERFLCT